ncbi:hypothetical protein ACF3DV_04365 [Chlorogloeopsis fritschii PCC 9212]|nr:hypothetical protein [Chlorogloeopsis fritschii]
MFEIADRGAGVTLIGNLHASGDNESELILVNSLKLVTRVVGLLSNGSW